MDKREREERESLGVTEEEREGEEGRKRDKSGGKTEEERRKRRRRRKLVLSRSRVTSVIMFFDVQQTITTEILY